VAVAVCPLAIWIARRAGLMDIPGSATHKLHTVPMPLAGGIALALSVLILAPILHLFQKGYYQSVGYGYYHLCVWSMG